MRLDLVLKLSGLIKRRTIAKELADRGRILINERTAKPSSEVKEGDILVGKITPKGKEELSGPGHPGSKARVRDCGESRT